jgi:adenylyltransferase/sulfurtransferase
MRRFLMVVEIHIPAPFRRLTGGRAAIDGDGKDVAELLDDLERRFPGFRSFLFDNQGQIPPHIKIYVNGQEITSLEGLTTPLRDGDRVAIIPATAGGSEAAPQSSLTPEQRQRYSRHIVLPHWGEEGQRKLAAARVLVVGTGGLGSPALLYLAGAGVGTLGIVEFDVVDISNLPRQLLHHMHDLGRPKAVSAQESIADNNPEADANHSPNSHPHNYSLPRRYRHQ